MSDDSGFAVEFGTVMLGRIDWSRLAVRVSVAFDSLRIGISRACKTFRIFISRLYQSSLTTGSSRNRIEPHQPFEMQASGPVRLE